MASVGVILASFALLASVVMFNRTSALGTDNCRRIHTLTSTLDRMIGDGRKSLAAYLADGTITAAQYRRELARIAEQRGVLAGADCPPRSTLNPQ